MYQNQCEHDYHVDFNVIGAYTITCSNCRQTIELDEYLMKQEQFTLTTAFFTEGDLLC